MSRHEPPPHVLKCPDALTFGNTVVAQSSTKSAGLYVNGLDAFVTVAVALEAGGDCSEFQIVSPTSPVEIDLFGKVVTVTFAPTTPGDKSCTIDVNQVTDGNHVGSLLTTLTATGTATAP